MKLNDILSNYNQEDPTVCLQASQGVQINLCRYLYSGCGGGGYNQLDTHVGGRGSYDQISEEQYWVNT